MKNKKRDVKFLKTTSLSQIFLLVFSIVAISYAIGSEIGEVSGVSNCVRNICSSPDVDRDYLYRFDGGDWFYRCNNPAGCLSGRIEGETFIQGGRTVPFSDTFSPVNPNAVPVLNERYNGLLENPTAPDIFATDDVGIGGPSSLYSPAQGSGFGTGPANDPGGLTPGFPTFSATEVAQLVGRPVCIGGSACGILQTTPTGYQVIGEGGTWTGSLAEMNAAGISGQFTWSNLWQNIKVGFSHALLVYTVLIILGRVIGADPQLTEAVSLSGSVGVLGYNIARGIDPTLGVGKWGGWALGWGIALGVVTFVLTYEDEAIDIVEFRCLPWQAPTRGNNCEKCNAGILPCSEYQCKSLGQSCELVNKGTTEERCVWANRNDVNPPTIEPWGDALLEGYKYTPIPPGQGIFPPDRGVKIDYPASTNNCIPPFTPLRFGITLNEPAKCKADSLQKGSYDEMGISMSNGLSKYNHSFALSLPGSANLEAEGIEVQNDGNYEIYMRCQDANGNSNIANFVFKYCVQKGPDTTPPLIVKTNPINGNPVSFGQTSVPVNIYVNEPTQQCKWSHNDRDYESMEEIIDCSLGDSIPERDAQGLFLCKTTLTGLKDRADNRFYFRCQDLAGNANTESFEYTIKGTQPLVIDSVSPNGTIKDSTDLVKVTLGARTSAGYDKGISTCSYSETGNEVDYINFLKTKSFEHSQDLFLPEASYKYYIRCIDEGGNADNKEVIFDVESDNDAPVVARAYHEETRMKLVTDEPARCVYDIVDCSYAFDDGIQMITADDLSHYVDWGLKTNLYVKCRDEFQNQPLPNQCSIILRASDFK